MVGSSFPLKDIKDDTFASGILGDGFAMIPIEGKVYAPDDGEVLSLFPTKHVLGIRLENGLELLIHVGINTVNLEGQGFKNLVVQGSKFKQGDVLLEFDINKIKKAGLSVETAIIVVSDEKVIGSYYHPRLNYLDPVMAYQKEF